MSCAIELFPSARAGLGQVGQILCHLRMLMALVVPLLTSLQTQQMSKKLPLSMTLDEWRPCRSRPPLQMQIAQWSIQKLNGGSAVGGTCARDPLAEPLLQWDAAKPRVQVVAS